MENEKKPRSVGDLRWQEVTGAGFEDMPDQPEHATQLDADKWLAEHLADVAEPGTYRLIRVVKVVTPKVETKRRVRL